MDLITLKCQITQSDQNTQTYQSSRSYNFKTAGDIPESWLHFVDPEGRILHTLYKVHSQKNKNK